MRKSLLYHCNRFFTKNLVNLALEDFVVAASFVFFWGGVVFVLKGRYEQIVIINITKRILMQLSEGHTVSVQCVLSI